MKKISVLFIAALMSGAASADMYAGFDLNHGKLSDEDIKGNGANVYLGYQFNPNFAAELGYRRLLSDDVRYSGVNVNVKVNAVQLSALAKLPLSDSFSLFARLGVNEAKVKAGSGYGNGSASETKALAGVGVDYAFTPSVAVRVEFQKPASDLSVASLGLKIGF